MFSLKKILFLIFNFILISTFLHSATINIPADQPTIQAGIDASVNADTVLVQPGTYVENINFNGKLITLGSLFLTTQDTSYISTTTINGDSSGSVVTYENGENTAAVLCGFTLTNGSHDWGGGIYCVNSSPSLESLIVSNNIADDGGGLSFDNSSPNLVNVTISGNTANQDGGGIWCKSSTLIFSNTTISGNTAYRDGGGIHIYDSSLSHLSYAIISGNTADRGGGICNGSNSGLFLENVTIAWNEAFTTGGAIACIDASETFVLNSILWNDLPYEIGTDGSLIIVDYSDIDNGWGGLGNISAYPSFVDPNNDNFNLLYNSPCIDTGDPASPLDPDGTIIDMGAYPFDSTIHIAAISDIPHDQGRNVQVRWYRSPFDQQGATVTIESYSVWRYDDMLGENNKYEIFDNPWEILEQTRNNEQNYYWQRDEQILTFIAQVPAVGYAQYSIVSPTLLDSSSVSYNYSVFEVLAHSDIHLQNYTSLPDSGYSVDNIAPDETEISIIRNGSNMGLIWNEVEYGTYQGNSYPEINGICYKIYAGDSPDFVCDEAHLIETVTNLNYDYPLTGEEKKFFKIVVSDQP